MKGAHDHSIKGFAWSNDGAEHRDWWNYLVKDKFDGMAETKVNVNDWNKALPENKGKDYSAASKTLLGSFYADKAATAGKAKITPEDKQVLRELNWYGEIDQAKDMNNWWGEVNPQVPAWQIELKKNQEAAKKKAAEKKKEEQEEEKEAEKKLGKVKTAEERAAENNEETPSEKIQRDAAAAESQKKEIVFKKQPVIKFVPPELDGI